MLKGKIMTKTDNFTGSFLCNPDVVLREEDEDGGLLFNPDTNQVKVVNTTGLFIWKQCADGSNAAAISTALAQAFEEAPTDKVVEDVKEFLEAMAQSGFIGVVENS
jgi:hypothetical protein